MELIRGVQIKVARVAAGMTHRELADESNVAISTIRRLEVENEILTARVDTLDKILKTLNDRGVHFSSEDGNLVWKKQL